MNTLLSLWNDYCTFAGVLLLIVVIAIVITYIDIAINIAINYPKMKIYRNEKLIKVDRASEKNFVNVLESMTEAESAVEITYKKSLSINHPIKGLLTSYSGELEDGETLVGKRINGDLIYFTICSGSTDTITIKYGLIYYDEISIGDLKKISDRKWWMIKIIDNNNKTTTFTITRTKLPPQRN